MDKPETSLDNNAVLVPFGPTRAVPENHRWCFACDGSGKSCNEEQPCCEACKGKGHWNAEDIRDYHAKHPDVCQQVCGLTHREPSFGPLRSTKDMRDREDLIRRVRDWLTKSEGEMKDK